eukprot:2654305-Pyramimonas_sp.AAC.2
MASKGCLRPNQAPLQRFHVLPLLLLLVASSPASVYSVHAPVEAIDEASLKSALLNNSVSEVLIVANIQIASNVTLRHPQLGHDLHIRYSLFWP